MNKPRCYLTDKRLPMLLMVVFAFGLRCTPMWDWDIWWHIKTGQMILERQAVPFFDPFTYGSANAPWIDLHWLFQVMVATLYSLGGINLLVLAKAALFAAGVSVCWIAAGRAVPIWFKVSIMFIVTLCLDSRGSLRPELLSFIFLAAWLYLLQFRIPENPRAIWLLPLIQVVWVNCHGLFVLGLVVYAAFLMGLATERLWPGASGRPRIAPNTLLLLTVAVVGASFCNPYLERGATFPLVLYSRFSSEGDFYPFMVGEFLPFLDSLKVYGILDIPLFSELLLFSGGALSFVLLWHARRIEVFRVVLFGSFAYLAWVGWRNIGVFAVVAGIVTCWNIGEWLVLHRERRPSLPKTEKGRLRGSPWQHTPMAILGVACLLVYTGNSAWFAFSQDNIGLGERENSLIHAASEFAGQEGFPKRVFVPWDHAGTYVFHNGPEYKVFMDGRLEVNTRQAFERHNSAMDRMARSDPNWVAPVLDEYGNPPLVILDKAGSMENISGLAKIPGWIPVYADPVAVVFVTETTAVNLRLPPIPGAYLF